MKEVKKEGKVKKLRKKVKKGIERDKETKDEMI
jgi:hypothetical protein